MIVIITGATHTGKTVLAQKMMERYQYPYMSIDHLKMGLIRSGQTTLTPNQDSELTDFLWPIVREIIKTAIENKQNLIIEGCYIPFDWQSDFENSYLKEIKYVCLIMSEKYISEHISEIKSHSNDIEKRVDDEDCTIEVLKKENQSNLEKCKKYGLPYVLIDGNYEVCFELKFQFGEQL